MATLESASIPDFTRNPRLLLLCAFCEEFRSYIGMHKFPGEKNCSVFISWKVRQQYFSFAIALVTDLKINIFDSNMLIQTSMDVFQMLDVANIIK